MSIYVVGQHGLGDNLHVRAVIRQLMAREEVWLETPWPCVHWDLVGPRLTLINKLSTLRTQAKNALREAAQYTGARPPSDARRIQVSYAAPMIRETGSVLAAMCKVCGVDYATADFRLPIAEAWKAKAAVWLERWQPTKPLLIYRPLNERKEWSGCAARNPDHGHYADLFRAIRDRYFVVSVADFVLGLEWMVGEAVQADVTLHAGELDFETLAALTSQAALVYSSPGFCVILGQAVGTAAACVFGGYENSKSFAGGARFSPYLGIDPINSCMCWRHDHACQKRIDMPRAVGALKDFCDRTAATTPPIHHAQSTVGETAGIPTALLQSG